MTESVDIRPGAASDEPGLEALYPRAFPDEELRPLVRALAQDPARALSLVALIDGVVIGHVAFTTCAVDGADAPVTLLGPLAVAPERQRQGVGGALVRAGLARTQAAGAARAFVLGDPTYYGRFGFDAEAAVSPPHPLPEAWRHAWRSLALAPGGAEMRGRLLVPPVWDDPTLWTN